MTFPITLPLRTVLPVFLLLLAIIVIGSDLWNSMTAAERNVELSGEAFVTQEMSLMQGVFNNLLRKKDIEGVRTAVTNMGANIDTGSALVADSEGLILAANDLATVGKNLRDAVPDADIAIIDRVRRVMKGTVLLSLSRDFVSGYYPVALGAQVDANKPSKLGIFYLRYDLSRAKAQYRYEMGRRLFATGILYGCAFVLLGLFVRFAVTRRVSKLLSAVHRFSAGDTASKANLNGSDELAEIGAAHDRLTETLLRNQQALRESHENIQALLNAPEDNITIMTCAGTILAINQHLADQLGRRPENLTGENFWPLIPPDLAQSRQQHFADVVRSRAMTRFEDIRAGHILDNTIYPVLNAQGEVVRMVIVGHDITERKRAERERETLQAQLLQAQKIESVGRLAGGVAHDFNNMLGVILGHVELALEEVDPAQPLHASLEEIRKAAQRSADLTRQLLAFARKQTVAPKVLGLNDTVGGMLKMLRRLIGEDIDLAWIPGPGLWPVKIDPSQIDQILANLCVNARDAISSVGKIVIETKNTLFDDVHAAGRADMPPGPYVMLAVSDNGAGMDDGTLEHVFEPFFTTKDLGQGTGLGLATVYGAVKQNNGFVKVYSEPGHGTTFKIYLPRALESAVEFTPVTGELPQGRGETVLLVEDEPSLLKLGESMLARLGYAILAADSPEEALRRARDCEGEIHLLITDIVMPRMNGRDLAAQICALKPAVRCLFMSGYTAEVIAHRGILEKGVHFIEKPFSSHALAAKVREVLDAP